MAVRRTTMVNKAGSLAFAALEAFFIRKGSLEAAESAGMKLGRFLYKLPLTKRQRNRALSNLELAFPEMSLREREDITLGVFEHFGAITGDFMRSTKRTKADVNACMEAPDLSRFEEARAIGKGIIMVSAHFGNWELCAHWFVAQGHRLTGVARDADDEVLQRQLARIRGCSGMEVVSRGRSTRLLVDKLKGQEMLALLTDQNTDECFVPYFGKPCGTVMGPAKLQYMTGAPILPVYCPRAGLGRYRIFVDTPIFASGKKDFEETTARINASLEGIVRQYPEQWLWVHDRWKSARRKNLL